MKFSKVLLSFSKFNWSDMVHYAMYVSLLLFSCPLFANPPFTKAEFDAAILNLQSKGVLAYSNNPMDINERDIALDNFNSMFRSLASYVDIISNGDIQIILLSGFKARVYTNHNPKSSLKVKHGEYSGVVKAKCGKDINAYSYVLRYSINENGLRDVFTEISVGLTKLTIDNLLKGREYMFSLAIVNDKGKGVFGNPVFLMVI